MNHLVCFVWDSTRGNHAGMSHMCNLLLKDYKADFRVFRTFPLNFTKISKKNLFFKSIRFFYKKTETFVAHNRYNKFLKSIKENDQVFLLEYLLPACNQRQIAIDLRNLHKNIRIIALAHLTPSALQKVFTQQEIKEWTEHVDMITTFGSSLTEYLISCGIDDNKVKTGFHYVDNVYYQRLDIKKKDNELRVIVIGNLLRDFELLKLIIESVQNVKFVLFIGRDIKLRGVFERYRNTIVKGYVSETEMRKEMSLADISLNVMIDTVGSNVITTSLSMGLAMIVSDVGSIRDYCNDDCAIFCRDKEDYVQAINQLIKNPNLLELKKEASLQRSQKFHISNYYHFLNSI